MEEEDKQSIEKSISKDIAMVEYYYGVRIDFDFPIMKRINMQRNLKDLFQLDAQRFGLAGENG